MMTDRPRYFTLIDRIAVPCDIMQWAMDRKDERIRRVAEDKVGPFWISTVFLGLDHSFSLDGPPILFETMVFHDGDGRDTARYATWKQADAGHKQMVAEFSRHVDATGDQISEIVRCAHEQALQDPPDP